MSTNLQVFCVQTGVEWNFDEDKGCTNNGHEHLPVAILDLNQLLAKTETSG